MPFKSEKQRRFLWAEHPEIAKRWAHKYPESNKGLPMYADKKDDAEKKAALDVLARAVSSFNRPATFPNNGEINDANAKKANSGLIYVDVPQGEKPTYAGEDREKGKQTEGEKADAHCDGDKADSDAVSAVFGKLAVVLAPRLRQMWEEEQALAEGREPLFVPENLGVRRYSLPSPVVPPPMGMAPQAPAQAGAQPMAQPANTSVGGGANPQHNPIQAFGPLGAKGQLNGNAAFGQKNSPDSLKTASRSTALSILASIDFSGLPDPDDLDIEDEERAKSANNHAAQPCSCGCGDTVATCKCGPDYSCRKPGGSCYQPGNKKANALHQPAAREHVSTLPDGTKVYRQNMRQQISKDGLSEHFVADFVDERGNSVANPFAEGAQLTPQLMSKFSGVLNKVAGKTPAWQRSEGKNEEGGLNEKGRKSYERETGGDLKAPVTESNPTGERAKRQNSFCSRMCGMKRVNTGSKTKSDPDSRINKSLRKWNCKCSSAQEFGEKLAAVFSDKNAGFGTALARGTARGVQNYNEDVRSENLEQRDNPEYEPRQEVSDSSGALMALLLGGGGLALAHGPGLVGKLTGGSRGRTKRAQASAKDIFDIVQGA